MQQPTTRPGWLRWRCSDVRPGPSPRALLECPDDAEPAHAARTLAQAGFDVTVCNGPGRCGECVLAETGRCSLVEQADVVVNLLGFDHGANAELLAKMNEAYPERLVIAETASHTLADQPGLEAIGEVL